MNIKSIEIWTTQDRFLWTQLAYFIIDEKRWWLCSPSEIIEDEDEVTFLKNIMRGNHRDFYVWRSSVFVDVKMKVNFFE